MIKLYVRGGFIICVILMDMEFEKVAELLGIIEVNIAVARKQVGEVENTTRDVKESGRGTVNTLPYYYLPSHVIINMVCVLVMWLNSLPSGKGMSQKCYPR